MASTERFLCGYRRAPEASFRGRTPAAIHKVSLLKRPGYELLAATVEALRVHARCAYPVVVRSGGVPDTMDGFCIRRKSRFLIHLDGRLNPGNAIAVLVHEWGHARAWSHSLDRAARDAAAGSLSAEEFEDFCHGGAFGVEYAHCWRVFTGVVLPEFQRQLAARWG